MNNPNKRIPRWSAMFNRRNKRRNFMNDFFSDFSDYFDDFFSFPEWDTSLFDWMNSKEVQEKLKKEGKVYWGMESYVGPETNYKPKTRFWGNIEPPKSLGLKGKSHLPRLFGSGKEMDIREPYVDVMDEHDHIKIIAEMPGIKKDDIKLKATKTGDIHITAKGDNYKYEKDLQLDVEIDPNTIKANYNNGVLEIQIKKAKLEEEFDVKVE